MDYNQFQEISQTGIRAFHKIVLLPVLLIKIILLPIELLTLIL